MTFNGGPGNCPAKLGELCGGDGVVGAFNGGPGNCPAKLEHLGLTPAKFCVPSMEGRAIARPNDGSLFGGVQTYWLPSMEGRAIARPNLTRRW